MSIVTMEADTLPLITPADITPVCTFASEIPTAINFGDGQHYVNFAHEIGRRNLEPRFQSSFPERQFRRLERLHQTVGAVLVGRRFGQLPLIHDANLQPASPQAACDVMSMTARKEDPLLIISQYDLRMSRGLALVALAGFTIRDIAGEPRLQPIIKMSDGQLGRLPEDVKMAYVFGRTHPPMTD